MLDVQQTIKSCKHLYNLTAATVKVKDQCPIGTSFYGEGDTLKLPLWYAKRLQKNNQGEIQELAEFGQQFNSAITNQFINPKELVKIDRDFYFMAIDYLYLCIHNSKTRDQKKAQFTKFYELRKKIILSLLPMGYNKKVIVNMAFVERLLYVKMIDALGHFDKHLTPLVTLDEDSGDE